MILPPDDLSFARVFRKDLFEGVEYSFSSDPQTYGTMLAGVGEPFLNAIRTFTTPLLFACEFLRLVERFGRNLKTDAYLFKVDWRSGMAERLSLYYRFIHGVAEPDLNRAFADAFPIRWEGPSPYAIGAALQTSNPVIVGIRVDKDGEFKSSVYFNYFPVADSQFVHEVVDPLVHLFEWDPALSRTISRDVRILLPGSAHAALGFDSATGSTPVILKVSAADVAWEQVVASFADKVSPVRIQELAAVGRRLRQKRLNYAAMKFGPTGYLGWKLYWAVLSRNRSAESSTRIVVG